MSEQDYYPAGAYYDPDAPWNQVDPASVDVECTISQSLSKKVTLQVTDYIADEWEDYDVDDDGYVIHTGGIDYDFSGCDFNKAYKQDHYDIPELLKQLEDFLESAINELKEDTSKGTVEEKATKKRLIAVYKQMLEDCQGWTLDDSEIVED